MNLIKCILKIKILPYRDVGSNTWRFLWDDKHSFKFVFSFVGFPRQYLSFSVVAPCYFGINFQRFVGIYCIHIQITRKASRISKEISASVFREGEKSQRFKEFTVSVFRKIENTWRCRGNYCLCFHQGGNFRGFGEYNAPIFYSELLDPKNWNY